MSTSTVISRVVLSTPERKVSTVVYNSRDGLRWYWQLAVFFAAIVLLVSRQPDVIFHPQFYGEDGHVWFADAYNLGWFTALFRTQDGYFQTLPRLAAAWALLWPLSLAPLATNLVGLAVQILPVPVLLSQRLARWGSMPFRGVVAFVYLALPNSREVNVTVTEAQWHLALIACLLVLAEPPRSLLGRLFDICVFVLCGLTGPFCIVLLPLSILLRTLRGGGWRWAGIGVFAFAATIQTNALIHAGAARHYRLPLGAGMEEFVRILAGQIYAATILGSNSLASVGGLATVVMVAIIGTALLAYAAYQSGTELRLFLLFSLLLFAASLRSPMPGPPGSAKTAWEFLAGRPAIHYWFFPTVAFSWAFVGLLLAPKRTQVSQAIGILLVPLMLIGIARDWKYVSFADLSFGQYAESFLASKPGQALVIPETPPGWTLRLVKK